MKYKLSISYINGKRTTQEYDNREKAKSAYSAIYNDNVLMEAIDGMSVICDEGFCFGFVNPSRALYGSLLND